MASKRQGRLRLMAPAALASLVALGACGGDGSSPSGPGGSAPPSLVVTVNGLIPLDPVAQGRYEAWATDAARKRLIDIAADNLRAFLAGRPLHRIPLG